MTFNVRFSSDITIKYKLVDDPVVDLWKTEITKYTTDDYCKINHFSGFSSKYEIQARLDRLIDLASIINKSVEHKIDIVPITRDNYRQALAAMHVHFPELHHDPNFAHLHSILEEYNDSIHWLESTLHILFSDSPEQHSYGFMVNLDFNKVPCIDYKPIPKSSLKLFTPFVNFGDLHLAYAHVGRHAQEIYFSNDLVCPKDQFVPQSMFTASTMMYFTNNFHKTEQEQTEFIDIWTTFYENRGGVDFWGFDIDDPRLAFGALKIGEIESIILDGQGINIPKNVEEMNLFRNKLSHTKVIGWTVE